MFMPTQERLLRGLGLHGAARCGYSRSGGDDDQTIRRWLTGRCDCKYVGDGTAPGRFNSEQNGCPELQAAYHVIEALSEEAYSLLANDGDGVVLDDVLRKPTRERIAEAALGAGRFIEELAERAGGQDVLDGPWYTAIGLMAAEGWQVIPPHGMAAMEEDEQGG
jgi:hypothetical protein